MKTSIAYLRKSRVTTDRSVSWEVQEAAVRDLAARHGDEPTILSDWNRSGRGTSRRPGYRQMLDLIEADKVSVVYSYSLSRLSRSLADFTALVELCAAHKVPIRFSAEANLNVETATATSTLLRNVIASVAQFDADISKERARDAVAIRRARGDRIGQEHYGHKPGEDIDAVVAAYTEAGSVLGAAKLLNDRGIPTRQGRPWGTSSLRGVLLHQGAKDRRSRPGLKAAAPFIGFQLLRCHCGATMTGSRSNNGTPDYTVYKCVKGRALSGHGKGSITERAIVGWIRSELSLLQTPERVEVESLQVAAREALAVRRSRVLDMYEAGHISRDDYRKRVESIDDELDGMERQREVVAVPALDFDTSDGKAVNRVLRAVWEYVQLDEDLMPISAKWRVPEWKVANSIA